MVNGMWLMMFSVALASLRIALLADLHLSGAGEARFSRPRGRIGAAMSRRASLGENETASPRRIGM